MLSVTRVDSRRVFALGIAGLAPAGLVTLLLVHQPSIGERRLYPMLRGTLAVIGLLLAVTTVIAWATAPNRLSRSSLSGLAWAGVAALLCIGPFLESSPRARLFALDVADGHVVWASSRAGVSPARVGDDLVVTDVDTGAFVGLDPRTGRERWRHGADDVDGGPLAAGAYAPQATPGQGATSTKPYLEPQLAKQVVRGGERTRAVRRVGRVTYVYVSTPGSTGTDGATLVKFEGSAVRWTVGLPSEFAAQETSPSIDARGDAIVIAGGEQIGLLDADDGTMRWRVSVPNLAKSRGYALPGSVQQVMVADSLVYLAATPQR